MTNMIQAKRTIYKSITLFFSLLIAGCAPGLGTSLEVTYLPEIAVEPSDVIILQKLEGLPFKVGSFTDDRSNLNSIEIDGRKLPVSGKLPLLVQDAFNDVLKLSKSQKCVSECITISGSIKEWKMKITPDFPASSAKANVELEVQFLSSDGYSIGGMPQKLSGKSSGSSNKQHPLLGESDMTDVFGEALNEAVLGSMLQLVKQL